MAGNSRRSAARNRRRARRPRRRRSATEKREWTELPRDILTLIFRKVGGIDVLRRAQAVCRPWRQISLDPEFWRIIDMRGHSDLFFNRIDLEEPTRIAVDCSGGLVEELYLDYFGSDNLLDYFGSDNLLEYIADRSTRLRRLVLISTDGISEDGLAQFVTHCPLLEEVQITSSYSLGDAAYKAIGQACPQLKCFRLNGIWCKPHSMDSDDDEDPDNEAIEIADSMPQLHELQLIGNRMTNKGLHAILDNCLQLESLDIRVCLSLNLDADLLAKLAKIKDVKLPNDSTAGYEFQTLMFGEEYPSGDSDPGLPYGDYLFGEEYPSGDFDPGLTYGDYLEYDLDYGTNFSYDDFTVPGLSYEYFVGYDNNVGYDDNDFPSFLM